MIIKRYWTKYNRRGTKSKSCMGYFLFGFIPLYVKMSNWD